jgi:hypothetical protein
VSRANVSRPLGCPHNDDDDDDDDLSSDLAQASLDQTRANAPAWCCSVVAYENDYDGYDYDGDEGALGVVAALHCEHALVQVAAHLPVFASRCLVCTVQRSQVHQRRFSESM